MDCAQRRIIDSLLDSYHEVGGINRIDSANLPSKRAITGVCVKLLQVLFPGYHDEDPIPSDELEMITGERIAKHARVTKQAAVRLIAALGSTPRLITERTRYRCWALYSERLR